MGVGGGLRLCLQMVPKNRHFISISLQFALVVGRLGRYLKPHYTIMRWSSRCQCTNVSIFPIFGKEIIKSCHIIFGFSFKFLVNGNAIMICKGFSLPMHTTVIIRRRWEFSDEFCSFSALNFRLQTSDLVVHI